ncbi:hypothetical protein TNCV_4295751 [Trichonephila clavipes]|nr:hypothetical protein TNCV_4295751 [Trichonephila clavipes]
MLGEHQTDMDSSKSAERKEIAIYLRKNVMWYATKKQSRNGNIFPNRLPIFYEPVKRHLLATSRAMHFTHSMEIDC